MKLRIEENVKKFILTLETSTASKVMRTIDLLEHYEYRLEMPFSKKVRNNIFELRIHGKLQVRIFYVFRGDEIILFFAFIKKTQKIPLKIMKIINLYDV